MMSIIVKSWKSVSGSFEVLYIHAYLLPVMLLNVNLVVMFVMVLRPGV